LALPVHSGPWPLIQFRNHFFTDDRTPWTSDQHVTGEHKHRTHTPNIHVLSGIRTTNPASENNSCLRARGYCDRPTLPLPSGNRSDAHELAPYSMSLKGRERDRTQNNNLQSQNRRTYSKYATWGPFYLALTFFRLSGGISTPHPSCRRTSGQDNSGSSSECGETAPYRQRGN
jgi:hypothetical protein